MVIWILLNDFFLLPRYLKNIWFPANLQAKLCQCPLHHHQRKTVILTYICNRTRGSNVNWSFRSFGSVYHDWKSVSSSVLVLIYNTASNSRNPLLLLLSVRFLYNLRCRSRHYMKIARIYSEMVDSAEAEEEDSWFDNAIAFH